MPTPAFVDLRLTQGNGLVFPVNFTDPDGNDIDVSAFDVAAQIRRAPYSTAHTDLAIDDTDAATGRIVVTLAAADTDEMTGAYVWEMRWVDSEGTPRTLFSGTVIIAEGVVR